MSSILIYIVTISEYMWGFVYLVSLLLFSPIFSYNVLNYLKRNLRYIVPKYPNKLLEVLEFYRGKNSLSFWVSKIISCVCWSKDQSSVYSLFLGWIGQSSLFNWRRYILHNKHFPWTTHTVKSKNTVIAVCSVYEFIKVQRIC